LNKGSRLRRVLIVGISGAGKSTLARQMGDMTSLPVVHLDREFWRPGWQITQRDAWRARVAELVSADAWIMDGNYGATLDLRLPRADTVIWFDYPRRRVFPRLAQRVAKGYGQVRLDMAPGCPERLDLEFLRWVWDFPSHSRPQIVAALASHATHLVPIVFRRDKDARSFMRSQTARLSEPSPTVQ
jgi:adenylate kinase family enzyme